MPSKALTIKTLFTAADKITGPLKKMSGGIQKWRDKTTNAFKKAKASANGLHGSIGMLGRAIGVVASASTVKKIASSINNFAATGDEIAKTSRQIGLTAESFQELTFAADRQGVSSSDLTKGFQNLNKRIGEARAGTGSLTTFLNKSNPALLKQLKNVSSSEEAFNLLVKEIGKMPDEMSRAALANAAFGRSGIEILKLAEAGEEGIVGLRKEAKKYGVVSEEAAKNSEKYVDALTNIKAALKGVGNNIFSELIKPITNVITKITEFITQNSNIVKLKIAFAFQKIGEVVNKLKGPFFKIVGAVKQLFSALSIVAKTALSIFSKEGIKAEGILKTLVNIFNVAGTVISALATGIKTLAPILGPVLAIWGAWTAAQIALNIAMNANPIGLIVLGVTAAITAIGLLIQNWDKVKSAIIAGAQAIGNFFKEIWGGIKTTVITVFDSFKIAAVSVWEALTQGALKAWEGIKTGFFIAIGSVKKVFFVFADKLLTVFGGIAKTIISVAAKIGDALGLNVSGLETQLQKINSIQESVRAKAQEPIIPQTPKTTGTERITTERNTVDINILNGSQNQVGVRQKIPSNTVNLNIGKVPVLVPGG